MFSPTKSLGSLKGLWPSLHQPLPLSKKESQKILNTLKTSFRSSLDKEYGWDSEESAAPSKRSQAQPTSLKQHGSQHLHQQQLQQLQQQHHHHHRPTDHHLRSILSNPLFKQTKQHHALPTTLKRDPMDVFDEAASKGLMTRKAATGCLMAKQRQIMESSSPSICDAMADSSAGLRVFEWLRSSGEERSGLFLADEGLLKPLLIFMVAEDLEDVIWRWAERLAREEKLVSADELPGKALGRFMACFVAAKGEVSEGHSLDSAYSTILRADETWRSSENLDRILWRPWRQLSWSSTVEAWNRPRPSDVLFDKYVAISDHLRASLPVDRAHLDLHHPTKPSHERALKYFMSKDLSLPLLSGATGQKAAQVERLVSRVAAMGMDTVKRLTELGQTDDAEWVLQLVQSKLASNGGLHGRGRVL